MYQGWNYPGTMMESGWMIGFHSFFWLVVLIVLVALAVGMIRHLGQPAGGTHRASSALEILEARYARGEIDRDEYLLKRKDLS